MTFSYVEIFIITFIIANALAFSLCTSKIKYQVSKKITFRTRLTVVTSTKVIVFTLHLPLISNPVPGHDYIKVR